MVASYHIVSLKMNTCLVYSKCTVNVGYWNGDGDDGNGGSLGQRQSESLRG